MSGDPNRILKGAEADVKKQTKQQLQYGVAGIEVTKPVKPTLPNGRKPDQLTDYERYGMLALNRFEGYSEPGEKKFKKKEPENAKPENLPEPDPVIPLNLNLPKQTNAKSEKIDIKPVENPDIERDIRDFVVAEKWKDQYSDETVNVEYSESVFDHIGSTKVNPETKTIIDGVINRNNVVYIGGMYNFKHDDFLKTLELAHKLNDLKFDNERFNKVTYINTNELSKKDTKMIKKHLYDTRTSVYFPFISVCGRSYTTNKQFVEMVAKDKGKHLVESLTKCKEWETAPNLERANGKEKRSNAILEEDKIFKKEQTEVNNPSKDWGTWLRWRNRE